MPGPNDNTSNPRPNPFSDEAQHEQVDHNLTNHSMNDEQVARVTFVREAAKALSHVIIDSCPAGPDRTLALRSVEQGTMMAVASIARER